MLKENQKLSQVEIRTKLPGPQALKIIEEDKHLIATGTKCWETPAVPEEGSGIYFKDVDGNVLMDWTNGMVNILGHSHPEYISAVTSQLQKMVYFNSPDFPNLLQNNLAKELIHLTPGNFPKKVFFGSSGTEAIEAAYKIARISLGKNLILSWIGDFHGRTLGSLATTSSKSVQREGYSFLFNNTYSLPFAYCYRCWYNLEYPACEIYCAKILERYFKTLIPPSEIAAIVFEPVQGEGGYVIPPKEFFQILKEIAKKYQILLIADEVQTCFGKSGYWTACEYFGIVPDIVALAKGLGNGAAIGATVFPGELDFTKQGMHSNTFGGQFISCISSLSTIKILKEKNMLDYVKEIGNYFKEKLLELKEQFKCIGDVRALGVLIGVEFVKDRQTKEPDKKIRDLILKECYQKGLLMIPCGESVIRITPSFVITKAEIDWGISILKEALEKNYQ